MKLRNILLAAAAVLVFASCNHDEPVEAAKVSVGETTLAVGAAGDTKTVTVTSNCDWTASTSTSWVKVSPSTGTSSTPSVRVLIEPNETGASREAVLTIVSTDGSAKAEVAISQSGEVNNDSEIRTAENFQNFLANAINATETDEFKVLADIDMGGAVLTPAVTFAGVLDGGGHKIYNYVVESSQANAGLILMLNGVVKDLVLGSKDGSKYDGTSVVRYAEGVTSTGHVGGLCAQLGGVVEGVKNFAKIEVTVASAALSGIGGISGMTEMASTIKECENYGSIELGTASTLGGEFYVGGIVAYVNNAEAVIEKCANNAAITIPFANTKASCFGGIAGRANLGAQIIECQNNAPISIADPSTATSGTYLMIAGIAGSLYTGASVYRSINKADITTNRLQVSRIGGIVGTLNSGGVVEGNTNDGNILTDHSAPNDNWQAAGGIVGFEEKQGSILNTIRNNVNNGDVTIKVENNTTHANRIGAGGILGIGILALEVEGNTNNGKVSVTNKAAGDAFAGGVTGWLRGASSLMKDNVNKGAVSCATSDNTKAYAGGVVGAISESVYLVSEANATGDKNEGAVTCANASGAGVIAGFNGGALKSCVTGGSVNGTAISDSNFATLAVGTNIGTVDDLKSPSGSSASVPKLAVSPSEIRASADAGESTFTVTSNIEWKVVSDASWAVVTPASGKEDGTVTVAYEANPSSEAERTAVLTVSGEGVSGVTVTLIQAKRMDNAPHAITSAADLADFAAAALVATPDFSPWQDASGVVKITADIDASALTCFPIKSIPADLVIDGQNHTITLNLTSDGQYVSIFNEFNGTLKNLKTAGSVTTTYAGGEEYRVAPMICTLVGGTVENCVNNATITTLGAGSPNTRYNYVGGIVAVFNGDGATISGCVNNGAITVKNNTCTMVGGITSYGQTAATAPTLTIENCENHGDIVLDHTGGNWNYIGGVVGKMGASSNPFKLFTIKNCTNDADITVTKAPKIRGGGVFGSCGAASDYEISGNVFSGTITVDSEEAVDRLFGGTGPGYSEAGAIGTISNCTFSGKIIAAKDGGNIYFGGIYGNNGSGSIVIDGCKATASSVVDGGTAPKSVGVIAARPNKDGFTVKNCKIAGQITSATFEVDAAGKIIITYGALMTLTKDNIADWMFKGSATTVAVTLENNGFNE